MQKLLLFILLSGLFIIPLVGHECDNPECDHSHDGGPPKPCEYHEMRESPLLNDPRYQKLPEEPLFQVRSKDKILEGRYIAPVFTADGDNILVSSPGYRGIWISDIHGNELRKISDANLASWRPYVTDRDSVYFRTVDFNKTRDVTYSIQKYDLESGEVQPIYQGKENEIVRTPIITKEKDSLVFMRDRSIDSRTIREVEGVRSLEDRKVTMAYSDVISGEGAVYLKSYGSRKSQKVSVGEVAGAEVMSPGGKKVVYLTSAVEPGGGMVYDLERDTQFEVGEGTSFAWSPDSEWLVYEVTVDDGHYIYQSELFIIRADGTNRQRITFEEGFALQNPAWSPDGSRIVAEDIFSGSIYMLEVDFIDDSKKGRK